MSPIMNFIQATPKVELHLHLVGSASPTTVALLAERAAGSAVPHEIEALERFFDFTSFEHFAEVYDRVNALVTTGEDIADLVEGSSAELAAQNVRYAEMTVTPHSHVVEAEIPYPELLEGLAEGRRRAAGRGVEFAWIYDIPGEAGAPAAEITSRLAVEDPPEGLVAFGLSGIEVGVDRASFAPYFDRARAAGLRSVPHAGEIDGSASIWAALVSLRADRIGHGVRAIEDDELVAHLVEHQIPLEVCPQSNVCTGAYDSIESHPIKALMDAGVMVTVNTDDPAMFSTTLNREYERIADCFDLGITDLSRLIRNGVEASFQPPSAKRRLLEEITEKATQFRTTK